MISRRKFVTGGAALAAYAALPAQSALRVNNLGGFGGGGKPIALVQTAKAVVDSGATTLEITYNAPKVGNLLWLGVFAVDTSAINITTPTGYSVANTEVDMSATLEVVCGTYFKKADGTEGTAITITVSVAANGIAIHFMEFSGFPNPTKDRVATASRNNTTAITISSGTTAETSAAKEIAIAFGGIEKNGITSATLTNSFTAAEITDGPLAPLGAASAYKILDSVGAQETTITFVDTTANDSAIGMISTFKTS